MHRAEHLHVVAFVAKIRPRENPFIEFPGQQGRNYIKRSQCFFGFMEKYFIVYFSTSLRPGKQNFYGTHYARC